jgi:hypothetical protein
LVLLQQPARAQQPAWAQVQPAQAQAQQPMQAPPQRSVRAQG